MKRISLSVFCGFHKKGFLYTLLIASLAMFTSEAQAQFPFIQRKTWDGPYDIKMIAAPNHEAVYLNPAQAASGKLLADSVIDYNTMVMTGDLFEINNQYKGGNPFVQVSVPVQATMCKDPMAGCGTLGLPKSSPSSTCPEKYGSPTTVSKYVSMTYADYDQDLTTFSSSMAQLDISACSQIEAAYLYWTGMFKGSNPSITLLDGQTNSYSGSGNVFNAGSGSGYDKVKLKLPGGSYQVVNSLQTRNLPERYLCVADVTTMVKGTGGGQFWVADLQSYPNEGDGGSSSGWVLVVIFRSPLSPPRLISLWDGLESISSGASEKFTLTGLQAPATNNFKSYVGFGALDGENIASQLDGKTPEGLGFQTNAGGAYYEINPFASDQPPYKLWTKKGYPANCAGSDNINSCKVPQFDGNWCSVYDGISSSHITSYSETNNKNGNEIVRLPSNKNTLGFDAHHLKLPDGAVAPGATQATLTVQAGPQGGTNPFFAYVAIERLQPKLTMTKTADKSSTTLNAPIKYSLRIKNQGNAPSLGGDLVYDTLDIATDYVAGSLTSKAWKSGVPVASTGVSLVSSAGDNLEFKLANPILPGDSVDIYFTVQVADYFTTKTLWDVDCKRTIINTAYVDYKTLTSGTLRSKSNANDCGIGSETSILVFDPQIGGSSATKLGPFDACALSADSIRKQVQAELLKAGVKSTDLDEYDIRDSNYVRVRPEYLFGTIKGTVKYLAIRNYNTAGTCQKIYELYYQCDPCTNPQVTSAPKAAVCSGTALSYDITSNISTATYKWSRAAVTGISNTAVTGQSADPITETLLNTTGSPVVVRYVIIPYANGCTGPAFNLDVTVNPTPKVTSAATAIVCSNTALSYDITSNVTNAAFSWSRAAVTGISNAAATAQSADPITETLINTTTSPVVARYVITPTAAGCVGSPFNLDVTVNPVPSVTSPAAATVCSNTALNYDITSDVSAAAFSWGRAAVTGISNTAVTAQSADPITEILINTTANAVVSRYVITPAAAGCTGAAFNLDVTVNPTPKVTSAATAIVCSNTALSYDITSNVSTATFSWSRAAVTGISNSAATAQSADPITETLVNTTASPVAVRYVITPTAAGCVGSPFNLDVTVNPTPAVTSPSTASICSSNALSYDITSNVTTASFSWSRAAVTGISNAAATAQSTDPIKETLVNTTASPVVVRYVITPSAAGCTGAAFNLDVTVNPSPSVTSPPTASICSSNALSYDITSNSAAATFQWSRAAVTGISNAATTAQSADPITETLVNTTSGPVVVRYVITPSAAGCTGAAFNLDVTVNPSPSVTSPPTANICSSNALSYDITSNTPNATFSWSRAAVAGISNAAVTAQSADPITETLVNTTASPVVARYVITPSAAGCTGPAFNLDVTVNPSPVVTSPSTATICSNALFNYDITSNTSSASFSWDRAAVTGISNAAVSGQKADPIKETLVNTTSSPVVVRYVITPSAAGCTGPAFNLDVTVSPAPAVTSPATASVCSNVALSYDITNNVTSANFSWNRAAVSGVGNAAATAQSSDPITETLVNTTASPVVVRYVITPSAGGCTGAPFNLDVNVNPSPSVTSPASAVICSNAALKYDITSNVAAATFSWNRAAVPGISNAAATVQSTDPITETLVNTTSAPVVARYVITPTAAGCVGSPFNLDVTVNPTPAVTSPATATICSNSPLNYDITSDVASATFSWSRAIVTGINNAAVTAQSADPITETLVNTTASPVVARYVITPSAAGCTGASYNVDVTVNPSAYITAQPVSANLCGGQSLGLSVAATGPAPLTYQWKHNDQDIAGATSASFNIASVAASDAGKYTVVVGSACSSVTSLPAQVNITMPPSDNLPVEGMKLCAGETAYVIISNAEKGIQYEAFIGNSSVSEKATGKGDDMKLTIKSSSLSVGNNVITIHAYGCSDVILQNTATIVLTPIPVANAGADIQVNDYVEVTLDGSGSSKSNHGYEWTTTDLSVSINPPSAITAKAVPHAYNTLFTLTVYDLGNPSCKAQDEVWVKVVPQPVKVPNAFSPNDDGVHDMFEIQNIKFFTKSILYVYNQWGELIYQSAPGYVTPWDGKRNGQYVSTSAYYYVLELNEPGFSALSGHITVIR